MSTPYVVPHIREDNAFLLTTKPRYLPVLDWDGSYTHILRSKAFWLERLRLEFPDVPRLFPERAKSWKVAARLYAVLYNEAREKRSEKKGLLHVKYE